MCKYSQKLIKFTITIRINNKKRIMIKFKKYKEIHKNYSRKHNIIVKTFNE